MWLTLQAKGYSYNDTIGRDGIESSMQDWLTQNSSLRKGSRVVERNNWSKIVREISYTEPSGGNNVKLTIIASYQQAAERATLRRSVEQLAPRERQIMELRFGLLDGVERTQKEVADAIGISQSYISRLEKRIIRQLREQLGE